MKKWFAAFLAALMLLTLFAGCSCGEKNTIEEQTEQTAEETPKLAPEPEATEKPAPEATAEPAPEPEPEPEPAVADLGTLAGTWKTANVSVGTYALSEGEINYYGLDLVVQVNGDGTGTVTSPTYPNFRETITFTETAVTYMGTEVPYALSGEQITLDYTMRDITFTLALERAADEPAPVADFSAIAGTWKTAKVSVGSYVPSEEEIRSYGLDLVVLVNEDGTGTVTSPSYPNFKEEITFTEAIVTYMGTEVPYTFDGERITLDYTLSGITFTLVLERAGDVPTPEPTAARKALEDSFAKMQTVESMHMDLFIDVTMNIGVALLNVSQDIKMYGEIEIDMTRNPDVARLEGTMEMMDESQEVLGYTEIVNDVSTSYMSVDGGKTWEKSTSSVSEFQDPTTLIEEWMDYVKEVEETGVMTFNGYETTAYVGTLSSDFLTQSSLTLLDSLGNVADEELMKDLNDIPFSAQIDNETGYLVHLYINVNEAMETLMERAMAEQLGEYAQFVTVECKVTSAVVEYTLSKFNEIPPIVIPDEVRAERTVEPNGDEDGVVGVWTLYGGDDEETQEYVELMLSLGMSIVFTFNADGTGSLAMTFADQSEAEEFTYTLENGQIVIDGEGADYSIDGDLLTIDFDGQKLVFKRK